MSARAREVPFGGRSRFAALAIYACAMGWLEAVVVVYIRALLGLAHGAALPDSADLVRRMERLPWLLPTEQAREVSTLVMLAGAAWLAGEGTRGRVAAFLFAFGAWDIAYYAALRLLVSWPDHLSARDVLFLIPPHPWWTQPVGVPIAISLLSIGAGLALGRSSRQPLIAAS
ncbi:MAG: hypothetical protein HYR73_05420 [Candidatus Eisenbacteria bacterium]|nr:hypothetical protein [Candidatus Eisenbacteria bacterium]